MFELEYFKSNPRPFFLLAKVGQNSLGGKPRWGGRFQPWVCQESHIAGRPAEAAVLKCCSGPVQPSVYVRACACTFGGCPQRRAFHSGHSSNIGAIAGRVAPHLRMLFHMHVGVPAFCLTCSACHAATPQELFPGVWRPTPAHFFMRLLRDKGLLLRCYTQARCVVRGRFSLSVAPVVLLRDKGLLLCCYTRASLFHRFALPLYWSAAHQPTGCSCADFSVSVLYCR